MHRLLKRQLQRQLGKDFAVPDEWAPLLTAISEHYQEADRERALLENALEINSQELNGANERLRAHNAETTRTMLNTLSDGVYATDLEGLITFMNASAETILEWREDELIGQPAHQTLHHTRLDGKPFPLEACPLIKVLKDGASISGEDHFIRRDGNFVPVSYRANPLMSEGEIIGSLVSFQDITQRQQSEALIRLQKAALDAAANMITITARNGVIEYVNRAFCQTTGYQAEEVLGKHSRILKSGQQDTGFYEAMWDTLLAGRPWEGELLNRRKNGNVYPEQMTITPILEDGEITHFVAIKRDISEEAKTKTRLKLIETAIQNIDQGILITGTDLSDEGMEIQYVNAGFSHITGYRPEQAIGQRTGLLRGPRTDLKLLAQLREALRQGRSFIGETVYHRADGPPYDVELQYAPVRDDKGKISHFIGLLSDISLRKQTEAAMRKARDQALENSRLKSEFLSTMSHEIRTPMNGIIGMTDLLLDTPLTPEQRDFTGIVRDSAHSLLTIINDILDFSKIEAGKMEIEITDFSPVHLVEGAAELLVAKAREKKLSLMTFIDPHLPAQLRGDPMRLRQVLVNLAGNAIKFTEHGEIQVRALRDEANWMVRFEIEDSGIGMSPETLDKLFQSFTQADSSTTRKYGGTGLGLAICKRLVNLMGGDIGVDSREGCGSTFWFTVPLIPPLHDSPPPSPRLADMRGMRVLVVDDRSADREILHRYLHSWNMASDGAASASEALGLMHGAVAEGKPYDIAVVDFSMPVMDGIDLAHAIRAEKQFDHTRLLLLTAFDQRDLVNQAKAAGFSAYLTKPVRQSQLYDGIAAKVEESLGEAIPSSDVNAALDDVPNLQDALNNHRLILLAEDNLTNQKVAQLQLSKLGYAVHIVNNGKEAVEALATLPYAAILMDCQMPVMDGFEATAAIRKAEQSGPQHIPIIAMTANAMQGDRERCLAAGMDDYLSKPIDPGKLGRMLATWTSRLVAEAADAGAAHGQPTQLIDFGRLQEYFGDDPQLIGELLEVFRSSTGTLLDKLHAAVERHDATAAKALAHEAKGSCSNLGIDTMAEAAATLERAATDGAWEKVATQNGELERTFKQVCSAIAAWKKENL
ncbi:MAG: PAS domain S-box protein [Sulfuricella sp.]|nr:PAS domain S-box protein [Sulfuricella sp.]